MGSEMCIRDRRKSHEQCSSGTVFFRLPPLYPCAAVTFLVGVALVGVARVVVVPEVISGRVFWVGSLC